MQIDAGKGRVGNFAVTHSHEHVTWQRSSPILPVGLEHGETSFSARLRSARAALDFFTTRNSQIGQGPGETKRVDLVVVLSGASLLFVTKQETHQYLCGRCGKISLFPQDSKHS